MSTVNTTNKVSIGTIIGNFVGNNGIENPINMIDDLTRWTYEAVKKIGSRSCYIKHECELEVKNYRVCLPRGFVKLQAIKIGDTKKDFRQFSKGTDTGLLASQPDQFTGSGNLTTDIPGISQVSKILFTGAYVPNDVVTVTISSNCEGQISTNTFTYIVQPGDTLNDVVIGVNNQILAIGGLPYTSVVSGQEICLTGVDPTVSFTVVVYTDSVNGGLEHCLIQRRVAPKKRRADQPMGKSPRTTSENLANHRAYALNTGNSIESGSLHTHYNYFFGSEPNISKFTIENGYVHFNAMRDGKIGISYWGILVDDEGFPLVDDVHEDAVSHYLEYMYLKLRYNKGKIARAVFKDAEARWFWLCGQARADDEMPDLTEQRYIANLWNQLLPLPTKNLF